MEKDIGFGEPQDDYDPLRSDTDICLDSENEEVELIGLDRLSEQKSSSPKNTSRSPEQRITDLLTSLPAQKKQLLEIIDFCRTPQRPEQVDRFTLKLQKTNRSVYTPVVLRKLLEEADALIYELPERPEPGALVPKTPLANEQYAADELQYLEVQESVQGTWLSTAAALAIFDAVDPLAELKATLRADNEYMQIYLRILRHCAQSPRSKAELNELVDDDPLLQNPRRYSGYFIDRLSECDALVWQPPWAITAVGAKLLADSERPEMGALL